MFKKYGIYAVVFIIGAAAGTYFDAKHTIEEKVVYRDRIKTEIKEIIKEAPDGTKITERFITKDEDKKKQAQRKESKPVKKDWLLGVGISVIGEEAYDVRLERRILGDIYVGVNGDTRGNFGVGVTILF